MRWLTPLLLIATAARAADPAAEAARRWRAAHERAILTEFAELLAIPNIASNLDDMRRNAGRLRVTLEKRGAATRLLEVEGAPPVVYGEIRVPGARRTVIFYAHYDGQPVEPEMWTSKNPFRAVLPDPSRPADPEFRLYARSASDDKAPVIAWAAALDAMKAAGIPLRANLKFFLEGEEEAGSPHLAQILAKYKNLLAGDLWIFCDGPVHQTRRQQIVFGARGSTGFNLTVYGPRRELHSGHYGNWAPNPAVMLAHLVASMRGEDGRVHVAGFYDDALPLGPAERHAIDETPPVDEALREELWLGRAEGGGKRLDELINLPALNVRGLAAAGVLGQSRNVVPDSATVSIDIRLVKGMDWRRTLDRVDAHIRAQGYTLTETEPTEVVRKSNPKVAWMRRGAGYNAYRAPMDSPAARQVIRAVRAAHPDTVLTPTLGGSLPLAVFEEALGAPVFVVPIANHDNNQHGHNENIRLQNLWDGIETMAALLSGAYFHE